MPRVRRKFQRYRFYHIFNRGNRKQDIFKDVDDYSFFLFRLQEIASQYSLQVKAYCLMDNHYHLIIKTGSDPKEISKLMQRVLTSFCLYTNKKYGLVGHVFQGRYQAKLIRTESYKKEIIKYFKENPVKAKYVRVWHYYRWIYFSKDLVGIGNGGKKED
jgi:putative transposase